MCSPVPLILHNAVVESVWRFVVVGGVSIIIQLSYIFSVSAYVLRKLTRCFTLLDAKVGPRDGSNCGVYGSKILSVQVCLKMHFL